MPVSGPDGSTTAPLSRDRRGAALAGADYVDPRDLTLRANQTGIGLPRRLVRAAGWGLPIKRTSEFIKMTVLPRWSWLVPTSAMLLAALALAPTQARAQVVKPFKITGEGVGPTGLPLPGQDPRPHWIVGEATHLGRHDGAGTVQTDSAVVDLAAGVITGEFGSGSPFVFKGANGERLVTWYGRTDHGASEPGTFTLTILGATPDGALIVQALWIAEFVAVPEESTGKFTGVTGSWVMIARSEPFVLGTNDPVSYSWEGEGRLTFRRGR
jgi:hypothetical protein